MFCEPLSTCVDDMLHPAASGTCVRFCCSDDDCGSGATCTKEQRGAPIYDVAPDLGLCTSG
jgi:hypothetical protein